MKTWQYTIALIRYRPFIYTLDALVSILNWLLMLAPGLLSKALFDRLESTNYVDSEVWWIVALFVALGLARTLVIYGLLATEATFKLSITALLNKNLLQAVFKKPGARALPSSSGDAVNRSRDDVTNTTFFIGYGGGILDLIGLFVFMVVALVIMMRIDAVITLTVFLPLVGAILLTNRAKKRVEEYHKVSRETTGQVTGALGEIFGAVQAIQVGNAENNVLRHFQKLSENRRKASLQNRLFNEVLGPITANITTVGTGLILLLVAQSMKAGTFSVGDFAFFIYNLAWITQFTSIFGMVLAKYKQTGVAFERMNELNSGGPAEDLVQHQPVHLHGNLPTITHTPKTSEHTLHELQATGLSYRYPSTGRGIEEVDLHIKRGSFTVITGRIGSGKTTLLRALLGLLPKDAGDVHWNGTLVDHPSDLFIPPRSAYTPQTPRLFTDTIQDNILMGLPEDQANLQTAIHKAVMEKDLQDMEEGLSTVVGTRGVRLSGGQIQRTAAARMFVRDPELLVFDDLSSALDVETERLLWERTFAQETTCLVVSHRRAALAKADHIIVLKDGKIDSEGTLEELLESSEEMKMLWNSGLEE